MRYYITITLIAVLITSGCSVINITKTPDYNTYIGKTFSQYSELTGMAHQQGKVLTKSTGKEYALMVFKKDKHYVVFMDEIIRNKGNIKYKIIDCMVISKLKKKEEIILECLLKGKPDDEIFCIAKCDEKERTEKEYFELIIKAWRADKKKRKINEMDVENVKAFNYDFGV